MTLPGVRNGRLEVAVLEACTAAVLVGVIRLDSWAARSMVPGAWSVSCADWRSSVLIVGVPCPLCSLAVLGVWSFLRVTNTKPTKRCNSPPRPQDP